LRLHHRRRVPDVFATARSLRGISDFTRDDGTPLNYTLLNIKDWCKNSFEVVSELRINTDNSHHRYDVILLINGVPVMQIEPLGINPRRAMEQIVDYKNDPGNGNAWRHDRGSGGVRTPPFNDIEPTYWS
jgi:type I restriction enzyme, R subunit